MRSHGANQDNDATLDHDRWRVAFDVGAVRDRPTGVGVYARSLMAGLARLMPERLAVIGTRSDAQLGPLIEGVEQHPLRGRNYHEWLQRHAPADVRAARSTIAHYTNAAAPLHTGVPFVLTVHDLSLLRHPGLHPPLRLVTLPVSLAAIARARALIVPSRFTRRELGRLLPGTRRRAIVVEHAPSADGEPARLDVGVLARLKLGEGSYILSIGTIEPRKNHQRLVGAFERLAADRPDLRLVLVGARGWRSAATYRRIEQSPVRDRIVLAGYVDEAALAALVACSAAVCYVSLYEGFGLPVIEAMAVGAAVVTSRRSSMPQAAGGAAVLVDPTDEADIARGIAVAMARRDDLVAAGLARTGQRTWLDVAGETIEVYRWALRGNGALSRSIVRSSE